MNFSPNMVFLNRSFDKKRLKALLLWFRLNLSESAALEAVEILQGLGFRSATQGAISLGLDDLKTPASKGGRVFQAQLEVALAHHEHHRGNRTPVELFQHLVDTWHRTSQDLTTEVVQLFHSTERVNPVYMMAFSGARGNLSQVRQLVGMRGLMADPRGQIVGFPILSNFREGLTITEYFVSCYGARKGVVDTAIRTADAGYLTRRLADVSHHFVVRTTNCGTHRNISLRDIKEGQKTILPLASRLVGRVLAEHIPEIAYRNEEITPDLAAKLASQCLEVSVRSPLSCSLRWGVCQLCYGWGLSEGRRVTLGEAVGIIAAQSIGEPGTQLTLRTFHTGGVFSGDLLNEIRAPYSGTIFFPKPLQGLLVRTPHGQIAFLTKVSGKMIISPATALTSLAPQREAMEVAASDNSKGMSEVLPSFPPAVTPKGLEVALKGVTGASKAALINEVESRAEDEKKGEVATCVTAKESNKSSLPSTFYPPNPPEGGKGGTNEEGEQDKKQESQSLSSQNKEFSLQPSTVVFVRQKEEVYQNQLLAEFSSSTLQPINDQIEVTQQVLSETAGQVWFKEIEYGNRKGSGSGSLGTHFSSEKLGGVWVLAGKPTSDILLKNRQPFNAINNVYQRKRTNPANFSHHQLLNTNLENSFMSSLAVKSFFSMNSLLQVPERYVNAENLKEVKSYKTSVINLYHDNYFLKYHYLLGYSQFMSLVSSEDNKVHSIFLKNNDARLQPKVAINISCNREIGSSWRPCLMLNEQRRGIFEKKKNTYLFSPLTCLRYGQLVTSPYMLISKVFFVNSDQIPTENLTNMQFLRNLAKKETGINIHSLLGTNISSKILAKKEVAWWLPKEWKTTSGMLLGESFFSNKEKTEGQLFWLSSNFIKQEKMNGGSPFLHAKLETHYVGSNPLGIQKMNNKVESPFSCHKQKSSSNKKALDKDDLIVHHPLAIFCETHKSQNIPIIKKLIKTLNRNHLRYSATNRGIFSPLQQNYTLENFTSLIDCKILKKIKNLLTFNPFWQALSLTNYPDRIQLIDDKLDMGTVDDNEAVHFISEVNGKNSKLKHFSDFRFLPGTFSTKKWQGISDQKFTNFRFTNHNKKKGKKQTIPACKPIWLSIHISNNNLFTTGGVQSKTTSYPSLQGGYGVIKSNIRKKRITGFNKNNKILSLPRLGVYENSQIRNRLEISSKKRQVERNDGSLDQHIVHTINLPIVPFSYIIPSQRQLAASQAKDSKETFSVTSYYRSTCSTPVQGNLLPLIRQSLWEESFFHFKKKDSPLSFVLATLGLVKPLTGPEKCEKNGDFLTLTPSKGGGKKGCKIKEKNLLGSEAALKGNKNTDPFSGAKKGNKLKGEWEKKNFSKSKIESIILERLEYLKKLNKEKFTETTTFPLDSPSGSNHNVVDLSTRNELYKVIPTEMLIPKNYTLCFFLSPSAVDKFSILASGSFEQGFVNKSLRVSDIDFRVHLPIKVINNPQGRYTSALSKSPNENVVLTSLFTNHQVDKSPLYLPLTPRGGLRGQKPPVNYVKATNSPGIATPLHGSSFSRFLKNRSGLMPHFGCEASFLSFNFAPTIFTIADSPVHQQNFCFLSSNLKGRNGEMGSLHTENDCEATQKSLFTSYPQRGFEGSEAAFGGKMPDTNSNSLQEIPYASCYRLMRRIMEYPIERSSFNRWITIKRKKLKYSPTLRGAFRGAIRGGLVNNFLTLYPLHAKQPLGLSGLVGFDPLDESKQDLAAIKSSLSTNSKHEAALEINTNSNTLPTGNKVCVSSLCADRSIGSFAAIGSPISKFASKIGAPVISHSMINEVDQKTGTIKVTGREWLSKKVTSVSKKFTSFQNPIYLYWYAFPLSSIGPFLASTQLNANSSISQGEKLSTRFLLNPQGGLHSSFARSQKEKNGVLYEKRKMPLKKATTPFLCESDQVTFVINNFPQLKALLPSFQEKSIQATIWQSSLNKQNQRSYFQLQIESLKKSEEIEPFRTVPSKSQEKNAELFSLFPGQLVAYGEKIANNIATTESGQVLYVDSQRATFRKAQTVLIYSQAILAVLSGEWIKKGTPLMALSYQKLVTGDIVQGLPKIEQFFEAPLLKDGTFWSDSLQAKLNLFFQEHREKLPLAEAVRKGFSDIQRVLVEGVQRVYISQGVLIADKHLEVIVRQMTCKGRILYSGDTGFLRNELVSLDKIESVNQVTYGQKALYHPQVRGITDASLESESFLSAASFQETTRVLSRDAVIGKTDLMRGLKERVIVGELIQAGTGLANNSVYNLLLNDKVLL